MRKPLVGRAMRRRPTHRQLPAIALLTVLTLSLCVTIVRAESGSGTITVSGPAPVVKSIGIYLYSSPGANLTAIDVDTLYVFKVTVNDTNLLTSVQNITLRLYTNSWGASDTVQRHYSFLWSYSGPPYFSQIGPSGNYLVQGDCVTPTLTNNQGDFEFVLKVDKLAINTATNGWTVKAEAFDKTDPPDTGWSWKATEFTMNAYSSLTIPTSVTWTGTIGSTYNNGTASPNNQITYTTNFVTKIQVEATTPTSTYNDQVPVNNVMIDIDRNHNSPHSFTSNWQEPGCDWLTGQSNEAADTIIESFWFVSIPAATPTGTYTFSYYIQTAFDSYPSTT
jgi:hypothetical protein